MALKIMLSILNNTSGTNLSLLDINIKFSRNKNSNLLVKTQAYMNLIQSKTLDPADCLTIVDLVSDVNEYISRGEEFWGDMFANKSTSTEGEMELGLEGDVSQKEVSSEDNKEIK
jgi:hypothetical protein